ncbi:hypothetical protein Y032_0202g1761 [Ancylostoma ceylanicum]|uniref:Copper transport protein n=1 Tax=Ancylostoma ceylanicum TaxID=53326 RepID=A0A016SMX3_9BILA|nr:hypothetical protein Y032_0202g1761 [Ancylostoma ceylanicum]
MPLTRGIERSAVQIMNMAICCFQTSEEDVPVEKNRCAEKHSNEMEHDHSNHAGHIGHSAIVGGSAHLDNVPVVSNEHHHCGGMSMAFHFGSAETILFTFWKTMDGGGLLLSCAGIVVMCFLMELVRFLRAYRAAQKPTIMQNRLRLEPTVSSFVLFDALLNLVQLSISYALMLIFMTFNVWLCLAVLLGEVGSRLFFNILFPSLMDSGSPSGCC